jgi:hypothetical protein
MEVRDVAGVGNPPDRAEDAVSGWAVQSDCVAGETVSSGTAAVSADELVSESGSDLQRRVSGGAGALVGRGE